MFFFSSHELPGFRPLATSPTVPLLHGVIYEEKEKHSGGIPKLKLPELICGIDKATDRHQQTIHCAMIVARLAP